MDTRETQSDIAFKFGFSSPTRRTRALEVQFRALGCTTCTGFTQNYPKGPTVYREDQGTTQYTFRRTYNGKLILQHNGFEYRTNKSSRQSIVWRCCWHARFKCLARARISKADGRLFITNAHHTHPSVKKVKYIKQAVELRQPLGRPFQTGPS